MVEANESLGFFEKKIIYLFHIKHRTRKIMVRTSFLFVFVSFSKQFLNSKLVLKDCCNGRPMGCPGSCGGLCNHLLDHGHLQIHLGIVDYTGNRNTEILKSHLKNPSEIYHLSTLSTNTFWDRGPAF